MEEECVQFGALGSYSKDTKAVIKQSWDGQVHCPEEETIEIFNFLMASAVDQPPGFFLRFPLSTMEFPEKGWTAFASSFVLQQTEMSNFYCFAIVTNTGAIGENHMIHDIIIELVGGIALFLHTLIKNNKQTEEGNAFVRECYKTINLLCKSRINPPLNSIDDLSEGDKKFFSLVLTSHLETQMTTIIETNNRAQAEKIITFLTHFTLPYQLELSSSELRDSPIQGLYIQCINPQKSIPIDILAGFQRPWTYVNLDKKHVRQSPDWDYQRTTRLTIRQAHLMSLHPGSNEAQKKINSIMAKYRAKNVLEASKWSIEALNQIASADQNNRQSVAAIKFSEIVYESLSVIKFTEALMSEKQQTFLSSDHVQYMNKILGIDDDDLRMAVGVATAFDPKISSTVYTGCQAVIKKMLNAV
jgi:hypothetical protein